MRKKAGCCVGRARFDVRVPCPACRTVVEIPIGSGIDFLSVKYVRIVSMSMPSSNWAAGAFRRAFQKTIASVFQSRGLSTRRRRSRRPTQQISLESLEPRQMLSVNPAPSGSSASSTNNDSNIAAFVSQNTIGILATVPGAPTSVVATSGNASLAVTWVAPASTGGSAITEYVVKYSSTGGLAGSWTRFFPSPRLPITATLCTVTGLINSTSYVVKVIAKNAVGISLPSANSAPVTPAAPRFLSAFWGLDDGMPQQMDGMPITFSWLINPASIDPADFNVIRSDGTVTVPAFATLRPANESGVRPVRVRLVGQLLGSPPGSKRSEAFSDLVSPPIRRLSAGPSIVDAWRIDPALLTNDANACTVGSAFVRVVWSGGITDFPTGNEVGVAVTRAYRLTYLHRGKTVTVTPLEIGDLNDGDNMHDLSFPAIPARAKLLTITLPGRLVEDPNGDPNSFQVFRFR